MYCNFHLRPVRTVQQNFLLWVFRKAFTVPYLLNWRSSLQKLWRWPLLALLKREFHASLALLDLSIKWILQVWASTGSHVFLFLIIVWYFLVLLLVFTYKGCGFGFFFIFVNFFIQLLTSLGLKIYNVMVLLRYHVLLIFGCCRPPIRVILLKK